MEKYQQKPAYWLKTLILAISLVKQTLQIQRLHYEPSLLLPPKTIEVPFTKTVKFQYPKVSYYDCSLLHVRTLRCAFLCAEILPFVIYFGFVCRKCTWNNLNLTQQQRPTFIFILCTFPKSSMLKKPLRLKMRPTLQQKILRLKSNQTLQQ